MEYLCRGLRWVSSLCYRKDVQSDCFPVLEKRRKPRSVPLHATGEPQNQPGFKSLQLLHYQSSIDVCLVSRIFTMANLKRAELSEAFDSAFAPGSTLDGQHVLPRVRLGVWIGKWLENVI